MFGDQKLDSLRLRKELLVLECDARRLLLVAECRRLRSPDLWFGAAGQIARRHPWLTAVLGAGAGLITIQALRHSRRATGWFGRVSSGLAVLRLAGKWLKRTL